MRRREERRQSQPIRSTVASGSFFPVKSSSGKLLKKKELIMHLVATLKL